MRRAAKIDNNHQPIVAALVAVGATVQSLARVGDDCPDLLVGFHGVDCTLEVKRPGKRPTSGQARWHRDWAGRPVRVVETVEDALRAIGITVTQQ